MITLLSPSKGQDFTATAPTPSYTTPFFIERAQQLIEILRPYSSQGIQELMAVSENIAGLNVERFHNFTTPFTPQNSNQALFSFTGDVYSQIKAADYSEEILEFAQNHLRILSGLYGVLRPLDLIQPYRLEMKTKLATAAGASLYQFWNGNVQEKINNTLQSHTNKKVANLASGEYFKVLKPTGNLDILTINFKEIKNNKARVIAIYAKRARGLMANHIMQNKIDDHDRLKNFTESGYRFSKNDSDEKQFTFTRLQPGA